MQPAVFLDRDDTLIHNDGDLGDPEQVRLIDGVAEGLQSLRDAGYKLIVVTNQGGVARGAYGEEDVDRVHQRIATLLNGEARGKSLVDRFYYCPYHPDGKVEEYARDHPWRKPSPGMILQAALDLGIDLSRSWMVGNQDRDVEAGRAAGCQTVLITRDAEMAQRVEPNEVAATFGDAVQSILTNSNKERITPTHVPIQESQSGNSGDALEVTKLRRAMTDLTEELRESKLRRADFTPIKMAAGFCQLLALLLAVLGLMQLDNVAVFTKWMIGAGLAQLVTMTLLLIDLKE